MFFEEFLCKISELYDAWHSVNILQGFCYIYVFLIVIMNQIWICSEWQSFWTYSVKGLDALSGIVTSRPFTEYVQIEHHGSQFTCS